MIKKIPFFLITLTIFLHAEQSVFIGQRFILTLPENKNHRDLGHWLAATKPSGVMLLASHVRNRNNARKLVSFLQHEAKKLGLPKFIIAIDWEGGIVSRPSEQAGFHSIPSPWLLAHAGRSSSFIAGMLTGQQLRDIGVTMNFAPLLDAFQDNNHILATRCLSSDPETIFTCAQAYSKGLITQGITPVIKHFPGLESATQDTHLHTAMLSKNSCSLFDRMLSKGAPSVMATHAIAPQFGNMPVTLSPTAVAHLKKCNPHALRITDDFCMKSISSNYALDDAAWTSLSCGYHLIIFSGSPIHQQQLIRNLQERYEKLSTSEKKEWDDTQKFITRFKHAQKSVTFCHLNEPAVAQFLAQRCITIPAPAAGLNSVNVCDRAGIQNINLITTDLVKIRPPETWFFKNGRSYLARKLEQYGCHVNEIILNPCSEESIKQLHTFLDNLDATQSQPIILQTFFYADGTWNKIQQQWLDILSPYQRNLTIVSLGHPHEHKFFQQANILNLGSFHQPLITRTAQLLYMSYPQAGADKLFANKEKLLRGKSFGLLCNKCSVVHSNAATGFLPDVLHEWATSCNDATKLAALFSPEHGMQGTAQAGALVSSQQKTRWGCPCYSLHGAHRQPTPEMLKKLDLILIDLQDVGVRCFTYLSTAKLVLEAAAQAQIPAIVLDHPNPLQMWHKAGPICAPEFQSFLGALPIPFLYGTTMGKVLEDANATIGAHLTVITSDHHIDPWHMAFIPPSPNLMSIDHVFAYPITVFLEGTAYSEGRGTAYPFMQCGAPWVNAQHLATQLNAQKLAGVFFEPISFTPHSCKGIADSPKFKGKLCHGFFIHIVDHAIVQPLTVAHAIISTLFKLYPEYTELITSRDRYTLDLLLGNDEWSKEIIDNESMSY